MNTENLAKCLQSLRHLYEDLGAIISKRGTGLATSPFSSSAFQCVAEQELCQVQSKALLTMMTAYGRNSVFPLDTMWRVLAWDEREDALKSLALYGVHQNDMDCDQVVLNRDHFSQDMDPDLRPYRWIDAKNTASWSQFLTNMAVISVCIISYGVHFLLLLCQLIQVVPNSLVSRKFIMEVMLEEREAREREQAYLESERVKEEKGKLVRTLVERVVGDICSSMLKKVLREELQ
ncbi:hypothetical protein ANCCEY_10227 [Ancylostoma ceylanicum]|uniref:Uncharacterized protein n=1 Tax=Ancylostoma ceylanicum TaxID=53326 RepID=A0A0D6LFD1_9BILA|nr:hypothetical protein ANCCEY_10227 [Ancylostoma ceylanicum]